ncbi:MAG: branched-chain amino acid ABC transporter permease [Dehalococcoidia bacterium]
MDTLLQLIVSGVLLGGVYALLALGVVVIFKATKIFNFAVGSLAMLGAYLLWSFCVALQLPLWVSIILVVLATWIIGVVLYQATVRPMVGQPLMSIVIMTLGMSILLDALVLAFWGSQQKYYVQFLPTGGIQLGTVVISDQYLIAFVVALLFFGALTLFFRYTNIGLAMRAVAENHDAARASGIKVGNIFMWTWVIATLTAAVGGILLGSIRGLDLSLSSVGLKAFPAILLGGLESFPGCIIGGFIIGIAENLGSGYLDTFTQGGMSDVMPWILAVLILVTMPHGLFGEKRIERI